MRVFWCTGKDDVIHVCVMGGREARWSSATSDAWHQNFLQHTVFRVWCTEDPTRYAGSFR
jgi:hypothetical protein